MGNAANPTSKLDDGQAICELQRLLLNNDALDDSDPANIVRVLRAKALGGNSEVRLKVLQTLPLLVSHRSFSLSESLLAQALSICFHFHKHVESPTIHHTATATLIQLITFLFDRVEADPCLTSGNVEDALSDDAPKGSKSERLGNNCESAQYVGHRKNVMLPDVVKLRGTVTFSEAAVSAYLLLHDLCLLGSGDRGAWLRGALIPRSLGVELVEIILGGHTKLFTRGVRQQRLLRRDQAQSNCLSAVGLNADGERLPTHTANGASDASDDGRRRIPASDGRRRRRHCFGSFGIWGRCGIFTAMVPELVCPLVIKSLRSQADFPLTVRLMRTVVLLVREYRCIISAEVEALLALLLKMVHTGAEERDDAATPLWHCALTLETLLMLCSCDGGAGQSDEGGRFSLLPAPNDSTCVHHVGESNPHLPFLLQLFCDYDENNRSSNICMRLVVSVMAFVGRMVSGIGLARRQSGVLLRSEVGRVASDGYAAAELLDSHARKRRAQCIRGARVLGSTWSASGIGERPTHGLDLLGETEPPEKISLGSVMLAGIEILVCVSDVLSPHKWHVIPRASAVCDVGAPQREQVAHLRRKMICASWKHLVCALRSVLVRCSDETVVQVVLNVCQTLTNSCGVLGLVEAKNHFINLICNATQLPRVSHRDPKEQTPPNSTNGGVVRPISRSDRGDISPKCLQACKTLFNVAHCLGDSLGNGWYIALNALCQIDRVLGRNHFSQGDTNMIRGIRALGPSETVEYRWHASQEHDAPASEHSIIISALLKVFDSSRLLPDRSVCHLISVLGNAALSTRQVYTPFVAKLFNTRWHHQALLEDWRPDSAGIANAHLACFASFSSGGVELGTQLLRSNPRQPFADGRAGLTVDLDHALPFARQYYFAPNAKCGCHLQPDIHDRNDCRVPPFFLETLVETTLCNMRRLGILWGATFVHFHFACGCESASHGIRALTTLAAAHLAEVANVTDERGVVSRKTLQCEVLSLYIDCLQLPVDGASLAVSSLYTLLQDAGHALSSGWPLVMQAIYDVASNCLSNAGGEHEPEGCWGTCACVEETFGPPCNRGLNLPMQWKPSFSSGHRLQRPPILASFAFKILQLIVDDFLVSLCISIVSTDVCYSARISSMCSVDVPPCLGVLVDCLRAFGSQNADINISLTAVNMVWTVSDYAHREWRAAKDSGKSHVFNMTTTNSLWLDMFCQLCVLGSDRRPEVRNCAIRTLCSIIVAHGGLMTDGALELCLVEPLPRNLPSMPCLLVPSLFSLLRSIELGAAQTEYIPAKCGLNATDSKSVATVVHHSRNTVPKQWNETRVLALHGIARVMRLFYDRLMAQPCFFRIWGRVLQMLRGAILYGVCAFQRDIAGVAQGARTPPSAGRVAGSTLGVSVAAMQVLGDMVCMSFRASPQIKTRISPQHACEVTYASVACEGAWAALELVAEGVATDAGDRMSGDNKDAVLAITVANAVQHLYGSRSAGISKGSPGLAARATDTAALRYQHPIRYFPPMHRNPAHMRRTMALLGKVVCMRGYSRASRGIGALERAVVSAMEHVTPFPVCVWHVMFEAIRDFVVCDEHDVSSAFSTKACGVLIHLHVMDTGLAAQRLLELRIHHTLR